RGTGTTVTYTPDPEIFLDVKYDEELIAERLDVKTYLNKGLVIEFVNRRNNTRVEFRHDGGVADFLDAVIANRGVQRAAVLPVLSICVHEPQFQGQTKGRLNNPEVKSMVESMVRPRLEDFLLKNRSVADAIAARVIQAYRAREASRAAASQVRRKTAISNRLNLPGKLHDCDRTDPEETELFIVEGDSAGGSAKQGRDRDIQAILP